MRDVHDDVAAAIPDANAFTVKSAITPIVRTLGGDETNGGSFLAPRQCGSRSAAIRRGPFEFPKAARQTCSQIRSYENSTAFTMRRQQRFEGGLHQAPTRSTVQPGKQWWRASRIDWCCRRPWKPSRVPSLVPITVPTWPSACEIACCRTDVRVSQATAICGRHRSGNIAAAGLEGPPPVRAQ